MKGIFNKEVTVERCNKMGYTEWQSTKSRTTIVRLFGIKIYCKTELFVDEWQDFFSAFLGFPYRGRVEWRREIKITAIAIRLNSNNVIDINTEYFTANGNIDKLIHNSKF